MILLTTALSILNNTHLYLLVLFLQTKIQPATINLLIYQKNKYTVVVSMKGTYCGMYAIFVLKIICSKGPPYNLIL